MRQTIATTLFNCCTAHAEPDWRRFVSLELGGCRNAAPEGSEETETEGLQYVADAEFFTVYGRDREGLAEAITDFDTLHEAVGWGDVLAHRSGLSLSYCPHLFGRAG